MEKSIDPELVSKVEAHEEIPPEGIRHTKALHISVRCKDHHVARVLVDNRDFDGARREVIGDIEISLKLDLPPLMCHSRPIAAEWEKVRVKKREERNAHLEGHEVKHGKMKIPHLSQSFKSGELLFNDNETTNTTRILRHWLLSSLKAPLVSSIGLPLLARGRTEELRD
ncbi:hypothetical protein E5676_scaffold1163G00370 [Cucumis melo var. makuwa]|uniref:Uncharacterized protein n=1 Tax=Cucumis melo var. makuwa TaxID=1194695 RepID=A0A5A7UIX9_CUCMM|nr:hypothetical protein E6C27_scaffold43052G00590 [Cucumis melo var. makuwa]TYK22717.1 hypothetical protein E5676_scaffold1163G00370 [Cucumis melo var. makuwa]